MRIYFFSLLSIMLALNASYVASASICGALESAASDTQHFGHHSHDHSDEHPIEDLAPINHAEVDSQASADKAGMVATASDHHHQHEHSSFSSILPGIIGVLPLIGSSPLVAASPSAFISVTHVLLDRPPCVPLA